MTNAIKSALGTQKQFAKQTERPYQKQLHNPNFGRGIAVGADLGAESLARSLGVLSSGIMEESIAMDRRQQEQFTMEDAERMLAGKTLEDLQDYDAINMLQHSDKGFNLTDNPYAIANLDRGVGQLASTYAKEQWAAEANTKKPKTINDAINDYNEHLKNTYEEMKGDIRNKHAYDQGFYEGYQRDVLRVAHEANQRITAEAERRGQNIVNVRLQELINNRASFTPEAFKENFGATLRELQLYCKTSEQAANIISTNLALLADSETSTELLNSLKDTPYWSERTIGEEIPMFKLYNKVANNKINADADTIYNMCRLPDGTLDWSKAEKMLGGLSEYDTNNGIPQVNLPISQGDNPDLNHLSAEMKNVLPSIGGIISMLGYGDVAQITSGYRDPERNAAVGGAANSYHTKGEGVDIYLGSLTQEDANIVRDKFKPYFREVLYHGNGNGGNGYHLHLAGYKGGLDNRADGNKALAYDSNAREKIVDRLFAIDSDNQRIAKEKADAAYQAVYRNACQANSLEGALKVIDSDTSLPPASRQKLRKSFKSLWEAEASGELTIEQQRINKYMKGALFTDMDTLDEYRAALDDPNGFVSPALEEKAAKATRRIMKFAKDVYKQQYSDIPKKEEEKGIDVDTSNDADLDTKEKDFLEAARRTRGQLPEDEWEEKIIKAARANGLDGVEIINMLDAEKGGGID